MDTMELFRREAPEVAAAFDGLIKSIVSSKGLDEKTKQLIYIALKASQGDPVAVGFHAAMARRLNASKAEVIDAVLVTLTVAGIRGVATCLETVVQQFEAGH
jgi:alkylhydroperoxidase/carboxymuconolactone decarboxylase family protein YurZ